jgi:hypothetical protein
MSEEPASRSVQGVEAESMPQRQPPAQPWQAALVALLFIIAAAEVARAWAEWRHDAGRLNELRGIAQQSLCAVTLAGGQIFYGNVVEARSGYVRLADVYYVQNVPAASGVPAQNRLVSREKNDWHGPEWMAIPVDKIVSIEKVGAQSPLAKLIAQDRGAKADR